MSGTSIGGRRAAAARGAGGPGLAQMRRETPPGFCPFCLEPLPPSGRRQRVMCLSPECRTAYFRCWRRDERSQPIDQEDPRMNAVEKALRHIEKLQKRLLKATPPKPRKPAKRRTVPKKRVDQGFQPPVTHPDVSELEQTFAPAPTPPDVEGPITPVVYTPLPPGSPLQPGDVLFTAGPAFGGTMTAARPSWAETFERVGPKPVATLSTPRASGDFRSSCKAVCAESGRQCKLPAHPEEPDRHRNERGPFSRVLPPGGVPLLRQRLDSWAWDGREESDRQSEAQQQAARRRRKRKSAHAGDETTTGLASIDQGAA